MFLRFSTFSSRREIAMNTNAVPRYIALASRGSLRCSAWLAVLLVTALLWKPTSVSAVSPAEIQQGMQLFTKTWSPAAPILGNDGLGPLFNATSCAACHNQGGVGGSGDTRFNAQAIGVESIRLANASNPNAGFVPRSDVTSLAAAVHPGLVQSNGAMITTASLPHFGGSDAMQRLRSRYRAFSSSRSSEEGGAMTSADVRENATASWKWSGFHGQTTIEMESRIFQRNTTSLFGAGLIDRVTERELRQLEKSQDRHPEISGHIAATRTGGAGRFGWRGNAESLLDFVDRACAAEMGLQTRRLVQPADIDGRGYRNRGVDIEDDQIKTMTAFIASLPAPVQRLPNDSHKIQRIRQGKNVFESVGCSVCHVETVGPASGVYSDLLLHDMGARLYDYDAAEPEVVRAQVTTAVVQTGPTVTTYYGAPTSAFGSNPTVAPSNFLPIGYRRTSRSSNAKSDFVTLSRGPEVFKSTKFGSGGIRSTPLQQQTFLQRKLRPSNVAQEWRTPPLWGVADSAPYMHDGRAETLLEAIAMHGGESEKTRERFLNLSFSDREAVIAFLGTLRAPKNVPQLAN